MDFANAALEPVPMVYRPNPYAEAPSLYDLYVQASASTPRSERFGLDVFQRGGTRTGRITWSGRATDSRLIMWGGGSQRLFRTVDREGRLLLPEAGPLLDLKRRVYGPELMEQAASFKSIVADTDLVVPDGLLLFYTGRIAQAPPWNRDHGFAWLFRLSREPSRLWHRYLIYGTQFVALVLMEALGLKRFP